MDWISFTKLDKSDILYGKTFNHEQRRRAGSRQRRRAGSRQQACPRRGWWSPQDPQGVQGHLRLEQEGHDGVSRDEEEEPVRQARRRHEGVLEAQEAR